MNEEMSFARVVSDMINVGIDDLREAGFSVDLLVDNDSMAKPVDVSSPIEPHADEADAGDDRPDTEEERPG